MVISNDILILVITDIHMNKNVRRNFLHKEEKIPGVYKKKLAMFVGMHASVFGEIVS